MALARVQARVAQGGHDVPAETIARRYHAGLQNFFQLYQESVDTWTIIDGSRAAELTEIAALEEAGTLKVTNPNLWTLIRERHS